MNNVICLVWIIQTKAIILLGAETPATALCLYRFIYRFANILSYYCQVLKGWPGLCNCHNSVESSKMGGEFGYMKTLVCQRYV